MRRRDREETRREEIINIIAAADCCRLGLIDDDGLAYSVPLNFAFVEEGDFGVFYFHGAAQGKKIDLVNRSLRASFEMDTTSDGKSRLVNTRRGLKECRGY